MVYYPVSRSFGFEANGLLSAVEEASDEEVRKNYDANVFGMDSYR